MGEQERRYRSNRHEQEEVVGPGVGKVATADTTTATAVLDKGDDLLDDIEKALEADLGDRTAEEQVASFVQVPGQ